MSRFLAKFSLKRFLLVALAIDLLLFLAGCTTAWVNEASGIVAMLGPAIAAALEILAAFGVGISPAVAASVASWGQQAQVALTQISTLITQYNAAEASAKPGILSKIQTVLATISSNLAALLPTIHITDAATQAKVIAVFDAVEAELAALVSIIPVVAGSVTDHDEVKALLNKLKSARQFSADFNKKAGALGKEYKIKGPGVVSDVKNIGQ